MAEATDAIWLDVLPSMKGFGDKIAKDGGAEADKAGKGMGKKLGTAMLAGTAVVAGGAVVAAKALYAIGETFDEVSDTIRVGTGATGKDLDDLVESAKSVGTRVPAEFEKIGTVVADVNTRLGLTGPTLEKFSSQMLEASRIMGEEIDINKVSSAFTVFKIEGEDTTDAMDHLFRVSQATGVGMNELAANVASNAPALQALGFSFEETAALAGNLDKAGLNSSKMMAGMSRGLIEVAKSGEAPEKAFKRVTGEIQGYIKKGDKAKAIDLASKLFGTRNATQFIGALESGALAMDDLGTVAGMTEDTILGAGEETMDFAEQWQIFKNNVLVKLEPIASRVFGFISDSMKWIVDNGLPAFDRFIKAIQPAIDTVQLFFGSLTGEGADVDLPWMNTVMDAAGAVLNVFDTVKEKISVVVSWIQDFWAKNGEAILADFKRIFDQIKTTVQTVLDAVKAIVSTVFGWLQKFWEEWGEKIVGFFSRMWDRVKGVIDGALQIIRGIWDTFAGLFTGDWERMWNGIKGIFEGAWKVVSNAIGQAFDALALAWDLAWSGLVSVAGKVLGGLWGAIKGPIDRVLQFIQENFIDKINGLFEFLHIPLKISPIWTQGSRGGGGGGKGKQAFRSGGYTGNVGVNDVAGVVHGREFVINAESTARIMRQQPGFLEALNGYRSGGYVNPVGRPPSFPWGRYPSGGVHRAYDFAVPTGTLVRSPYDAQVVAAGWDSTGFGQHVRTRDADGAYSIFGHLSQIMAGVGAVLKAGQPLGRVGSTGNSTGPHLHWERRGAPYDPGSAFNPDGGGGNFFTNFISDIVRSGIDGIVGVVSRGLGSFGWLGDLMGGVVKRLGSGLAGVALRLLGMEGGQDRPEVTPLLFDSGGVLPTGISVVRNNTGRAEPLRRADEGLDPVVVAELLSALRALESVPERVEAGARAGIDGVSRGARWQGARV